MFTRLLAGACGLLVVLLFALSPAHASRLMATVSVQDRLEQVHDAVVEVAPGELATVHLYLELDPGARASQFDGIFELLGTELTDAPRLPFRRTSPGSMPFAIGDWDSGTVGSLADERLRLSLARGSIGSLALLAEFEFTAREAGNVMIYVDKADVFGDPAFGSLLLEQVDGPLQVVSITPEPGTGVLMAVGLAGLAYFGRRPRFQRQQG